MTTTTARAAMTREAMARATTARAATARATMASRVRTETDRTRRGPRGVAFGRLCRLENERPGEPVCPPGLCAPSCPSLLAAAPLPLAALGPVAPVGRGAQAVLGEQAGEEAAQR